MWTWLQWYFDWKRIGILPFDPQELLEQPAWVFQAIDKIDRTFADLSNTDQRRARQEQERTLAEMRKLGAHGR